MSLFIRARFLLAASFILSAALRPCFAGAIPKRIVSLTPAVTEIIYSLGLDSSLVGDTTACDYPPQAKSKPHVGGSVINIEAVVGLSPDLVIGDESASSAALGRLSDAHVPTLALTNRTLADVEQNIVLIGKQTGTIAKARQVVAQMEHKRHQAAELTAGNNRRPRALDVIWTDPLYVPCSDTFMGQMLLEAGADNVANGKGYITYSKESAIASRPDIIFCNAAVRVQILRDPAWRTAPALHTGHVCVIDDSLIQRPGPRLADGLLIVARRVSEVAH